MSKENGMSKKSVRDKFIFLNSAIYNIHIRTCVPNTDIEGTLCVLQCPSIGQLYPTSVKVYPLDSHV